MNGMPLLIAAAALLAAVGCDRERSGPAGASARRGGPGGDPLVVSGLRIQPQPGWIAEPAASASRIAQFSLPPANVAATKPASLIIYHFGPGGAGTIEANLDRWIGQFEQPGGGDASSAARLDEHQINDLAVHTIDLAGNYVAETSPGSGERVNEPGWRLLGAIVQTQGGPYYIKLVGPAPVVAHWSESYHQMLDALAPAAPLAPAPPPGATNAGAVHP